MALPSSPPITLSEIQSVFSGSSLADSSVRASLNLPTALTDFLNTGPAPPPPPPELSGTWRTSFNAFSERASFSLSVTGARPNTYWEFLQFPGLNTDYLYPGGWDGGPAVSGYVDGRGNVSWSFSNFGDRFWWPTPRGNVGFLRIRAANNSSFEFGPFNITNSTGFQSYSFPFSQ